MHVRRSAGERKAHWPGAAASDVPIGARLIRLLPVQWSAKLAGARDAMSVPHRDMGNFLIEEVNVKPDVSRDVTTLPNNGKAGTSGSFTGLGTKWWAAPENGADVVV